MQGDFVAAVNRAVARCLNAADRMIKRFFKPAAMAVVAGVVEDVARSKFELVAENAMLRQQLIVASRSVKRPFLHNGDRLFMILLARFNRAWRDSLHLIQPETLLRWHRDLFKIIWRRKSRCRRREARLPQETIDLIKRMTAENPWGAERIRGELLKLGIRVSKRTVQRHMRGVRDPKKPPQDWRTFLANHAKDVWACDFIQVYDVLFRPVFAFIIVEHESRRVVHFSVTRSPTDSWVAQQLREATPYCEGPRFLIRDNDSKYGAKFDAVAKACGTKVLRTAVKAPLMNSVCERFLGSVRRECLDHILILGEDHLRRVLREYVTHYLRGRPHQGLAQRTPEQVVRGEQVGDGVSSPAGKVISIPVLGGLHHEYRRAA